VISVAHFTYESKMIMSKIIRWLVFGVVLAVLPLIAKAASIALREAPLTSVGLVGGGELFLVASLLSARAIGELIGTNKDFLSLKLIAGGATLVILFLASFAYSEVSTSAELLQHKDQIVSQSAIYFGCAIAGGLGCILLAEA
jgi:hypothetical protein